MAPAGRRQGRLASLRKSILRNYHPRVRLVLVAVITNIAALLYGFDVGCVSWIIDEDNDDDAKWLVLLASSAGLQGAVLSTAYLGAALTCAFVCWRGLGVGRKDELMLSAWFYFLGALLIGLSDRADWDTVCAFIFLLGGRVIYGIGLGLAVGSLTTYLGEITGLDADLRSSLLSGVEVVQVLGILLGSVLGAATAAPVNAYFVAMGFALVQLMGLLVLPESPRYMLQNPEHYTRGEAMLSVRYLDEHATFADLESMVAEASPRRAAAAAASPWTTADSPARARTAAAAAIPTAASPGRAARTMATAAAAVADGATPSPRSLDKSKSAHEMRPWLNGPMEADAARAAAAPSMRRRANTLVPTHVRLLSMDALEQVAHAMIDDDVADIGGTGAVKPASGGDSHSRRRQVRGRIFAAEYRPHLAVALCLVACRQLTGFTVAIFYSESLWADVGVGGAYAGVFAAGSARVIAVLLAAAFMERLPRKGLLLSGTALMGVSSTLLAVALPFAGGTLATVAGTLGILGLNFWFEYTIGTVMWVILGEIFPTAVRREGISFSVALNFSVGAACVFLLPVVKSAIGVAGMMVMSAAFCVACLVAASPIVVETLGRDLDEIQLALANASAGRGLKVSAPLPEAAVPATAYGTRGRGAGGGNGGTRTALPLADEAKVPLLDAQTLTEQSADI